MEKINLLDAFENRELKKPVEKNVMVLVYKDQYDKIARLARANGISVNCFIVNLLRLMFEGKIFIKNSNISDVSVSNLLDLYSFTPSDGLEKKKYLLLMPEDLYNKTKDFKKQTDTSITSLVSILFQHFLCGRILIDKSLLLELKK